MTKTAQNWLDTKYSDKTVGGKIELFDKNLERVEELTDELLIDGYINIEEIDLERWDKRKWEGKLKGQITKITISNCPKVKKLKFNNNEISEIIFEGEFPDLVQLDSMDNKLTEIDISKTPNLELLNVTRNPITKIKGLERSTKLRSVNLVETPGFNGQEYKKWEDAIKEILGIPTIDPLPNDWKTGLETKLDELKNRPTQEKLNEAVENGRKKVQGYENGLKNTLGLGSTDNLPTDWQTQLAKKDDLTAAQNDLDKNKQIIYKLQKELDDLKSKPTGTILTAEQQKKLNDYETMVAYFEENMGDEWRACVLVENK